MFWYDFLISQFSWEVCFVQSTDGTAQGGVESSTRSLFNVSRRRSIADQNRSPGNQFYIYLFNYLLSNENKGPNGHQHVTNMSHST